jgi:hypothetical protein
MRSEELKKYIREHASLSKFIVTFAAQQLIPENLK